jgi:GNAT superfamily N-acetyltransferase
MLRVDMASYRFCRSDDAVLLVRAYDTCCRPHLPGRPLMTVEDLKRDVREIDLWTSGCMVAAEGDEPIAVVLAAKRETEALVHQIGVRPDRIGQGHGRHLLASLGAKLAILGPRRIVAEVPTELSAARTFLGKCGYRAEVEYADFVRHPSPSDDRGAELVIPITAEELMADGALDDRGRRCWQRAPAALARRSTGLRGLAVASAERIEAYLLSAHDERAPETNVVALGCRDSEKRGLWIALLLRRLAAEQLRPLRIPRVHPDEIAFDVLRDNGFVEDGRTIGYVADAMN